MTPIADMVAQMLAAGVPHGAIVLAVRTAEISANRIAAPTQSAIDPAAERRRAWDRERKRATKHLRLSESEWLPLVGLVLRRDNHECQYCGAREHLTADHVLPVSRGGGHDPSNLVACCIPCNTKKSNKLVCEWLPNPPDSTRHDEGIEIIRKAYNSAIFPPDSTRIHPTQNLSLIEERKIEVLEPKKDRKRKVGPIPPDWSPPPRAFEIASELRLSIPEIEPRFRDYLASSGRQYADYDAGFCNFVRNTPRFNGGTYGPAGSHRTNQAARPRQSSGDAFVSAMADELAKRPESRLYEPPEDSGEVGPDGRTTLFDRRTYG